MTRKKDKTSGSQEGESFEQKPVSYRPSVDVARAMKEYRDRFKVKPSKSAIIERALREFFKSEGIQIELEAPGET
jgi:hypothetical protein